MTAATAPPGTLPPSFLFGDFVLDGARRELRRGGAVLAVEPKVLDLLAWLLAHRERVVSRDELFAALWPGQHVGDEALSYCVKAARRAVGDSGARQHTIVTVRGRGYRFVAEAHEHLRQALLAGRSTPAEGATGFFVGRERVMARLNGALAAATAGHGRLVLLSGEPGIGKTRTADELALAARRQGIEVLIGRCHEGGGAPSFWPWVQILRACVAVRDRRSVLATLGPRAAELARLVPDLATLLGTPVSGPPESDDARFRLFDATASFLVDLAARAPLVLVLDDLHWADTPSLLLLQFLARELGAAPLLVVGTVRDTEVAPDHPLVACLATLARTARVDRLALEGLTVADVELLLEAATGDAPRQATARDLHERTGGNPFFVGETVRLLFEQRGDAASSSTVPGGVREVVRQRVASLSEDARRALRVAAVLGQEFATSLVVRAGGASRRDGGALLAGLDAAAHAHLIVRRDAGTFRFAHGLVRTTIYDDLPTRDRVRLHQRAGDAIAATYAAELEAHVAALAYHFTAAAIVGDARQAIRWSIEAGDRAAAMLAWEDAALHHAQALELLERAPAVPSRVGRPAARAARSADVDRVLFALGESLWKCGELGRAKAMFRRAAQRARAARASDRLALAALGFGGGFRGFELGEVDLELIDLLEEALRALPRRASGLRARVTARLAVALYHVPDSLERRRVLSADAVRMAAASRDRAAELAALYARHGAIWGPDTLRERIATAGTMLRLATRVGDREAALHAHRFHLIDAFEIGDAAAVDADLAACARLGAELRQPYYLWYAATVRATRALLDGRLADSERAAIEARDAGRRAQSGNVEQVYVSQLAWIRREQGRLDEIEPVLRDLVERFPAMPVWRCTHAFVLAELGRLAEARAPFELLAANGFAVLVRDAFWLSATCALAEVCAALGDQTRAQLLQRALAPYAGRVVQVSIGAGLLGAVDRTLGLLRLLVGRGDAVAHFDAALAIEERLRAPLLVARTRCQRAAALLARGRAGDVRAALADLARAEDSCRPLGLPCDGIAELRAQVSARAARDVPPSGRSPRRGRRGDRPPG